MRFKFLADPNGIFIYSTQFSKSITRTHSMAVLRKPFSGNIIQRKFVTIRNMPLTSELSMIDMATNPVFTRD